MHKNWPQHIRSKAGYLRAMIYRNTPPGVVLPPKELCLKAFDMDPNDVRVVILGQDPYHTPGKAVGRAFAVPEGWTDIGSSIANIIEEVYHDTQQRVDPTLQSWTDQGVLLLNTRLTVLTGQPMSHAGLGWEELVADVLEYLSGTGIMRIYLLWGKEAKRNSTYIDRLYSDILETSHPCKFSAHRGFRGCRHFSKVNRILESDPIVWGVRE